MADGYTLTVYLTRRQIRYVGASASSAMAVVYLPIGLGILDIGASRSGDVDDLALFGFSAGAAYQVLALLLTFTDRRRPEATMPTKDLPYGRAVGGNGRAVHAAGI